MKIQVKLLNENATLPIYATEGSAGFDIFASEDFVIPPTTVQAKVPKDVEEHFRDTLTNIILGVSSGKVKTIADVSDVAFELTSAVKDLIETTKYDFSLGRKQVATGVAFGIPIGSNIELEIRSKSGLAFKLMVHAFNGTLDEDYTQELMVMVYNLTSNPIHFKKGEKVAQGVFKKIIQGEFDLVTEFNREVIPNPERDNNPSVMKKERKGGFGSTGITKDGEPITSKNG